MDDDPQPPAENHPPARPRLSSTPSWVMLGFILGALFVFLLPPSFKGVRPAAKPGPATLALKAKAVPRPATPERLTEVEAVFAMWGTHAIWDDNRTEIAMWDRTTNAFTDYYEVIRVDGALYFRSIPELTRPLLEDSTHSECPLLFTESKRMHDQWLRHRADLVPAPSMPPEIAKPEPAVPPSRAP